MITLSALNDITGLRHAFFTRDGGISEGIYASLNCGLGSKDKPENVMSNRARAMAMMDQSAEALITCHQAHTTDVLVVEAPWPAGSPPVADAMVTTTPNLVLGIMTADCAPVLLVDPKAKVIGAAHAGWRGALGGVLENTVATMVKLGAKRSRMIAAVGPCIAQRSYEVGPDFPKPFLEQTSNNRDFFAPSRKVGHWMFDLPAYVSRRLGLQGLGIVVRTPCDTCQDPIRFFSYRRTTLMGETDYGRALSAIVIEG